MFIFCEFIVASIVYCMFRLPFGVINDDHDDETMTTNDRGGGIFFYILNDLLRPRNTGHMGYFSRVDGDFAS